MTDLTITHTPIDGTLIDGTTRGDGVGRVLKASGWHWSSNLDSWYIPRSRDRQPDQTKIEATRASLEAEGFSVELAIEHGWRSTPDVESGQIAHEAARAGWLADKAERAAEQAGKSVV